MASNMSKVLRLRSNRSSKESSTEFLALGEGSNTLITSSHKIRAGRPSSLQPASKEITSASAVEWDTAPCFLQIQLMGAKVLGPTKHKRPPEVDLESRKSHAKLASENSVSQHFEGGSPTKQVCACSTV